MSVPVANESPISLNLRVLRTSPSFLAPWPNANPPPANAIPAPAAPTGPSPSNVPIAAPPIRLLPPAKAPAHLGEPSEPMFCNVLSQPSPCANFFNASLSVPEKNLSCFIPFCELNILATSFLIISNTF